MPGPMPPIRLERQQAEQFLAYLQQEKNFAAGDAETPETATAPQPSGNSSSTTSAASSSANAADATHTQPSGEPVNAGNLREATGMVTKLSCMNGLKFEMATDAGPLTLHISPGANFQVRLTTKPSGPFNPCKAIQGQRVKVEYQPDGAKGKTGTVESLTVLAGANDTDGSLSSDGGRRLAVGSDHKEAVTTAAEGNVSQVLCNGNELTLNLDAGESSFILHARDATRVPYEKDVAFDTKDFKPCTQLEGHRVKITFVVVDGKTYDGEIQSVEIMK